MLLEFLLGFLLCLSPRDTVVSQTCTSGSVSYQCDRMYVYIQCSFSSHHLYLELQKSALITLGVLFVLISGMTKMLVLSPTNWDTLLMVNKVCLICFTKMLFCIMYVQVQQDLLQSTTYFSSAIKHNIIDLNCNENTILDCLYNGLSDYYCSLSKDANIF